MFNYIEKQLLFVGTRTADGNIVTISEQVQW